MKTGNAGNVKCTAYTRQECSQSLLKKEGAAIIGTEVLLQCGMHESFLDFQQATRLNAEGLTEEIIHCLERHGLE